MLKSTPRAALIAGAAMLLTLACGKATEADASRVIANVGGEKITEAEFQETVKALSPDPKEAQTFLTDPAAREDRAQLASRIAMSRAITAYAKQTGLDQDATVRRQLEQQQATIFFQAMAKQRMPAADPTEEQLRAFYQEQVDKVKAQGGAQAIPPFEAIKAQVAEGWKQFRMRAISQEIQAEVKAKVPVTLADDYRPAGE